MTLANHSRRIFCITKSQYVGFGLKIQLKYNS